MTALFFGFIRDAAAGGGIRSVGIRTIRGLIGASGAVLGEHEKPVWVEYDEEDTAILGPENPDDPDSKNIARIWLDTSEPDEIRWTSSAGSVEPASEEKSSGYFATTLTIPKTKGAFATVRASLGDGAGNGFVESPTIRVVAGKPKSIEVQCSGRTAIGEIGEVTIAATVRDEWGNLVEDGTGVDFSIDGDTSFSCEFNTTDGVARAVLKCLETPGEKYVTISSGDVKVVETVVVEDVDITISMPPTILAGEKCPVTIHASTAAGSMDGRAIALRRNRGAAGGIRADAGRRRSRDDLLRREAGGVRRGNRLVRRSQGRRDLRGRKTARRPPDFRLR